MREGKSGAKREMERLRGSRASEHLTELMMGDERCINSC